ncbi:MAG: hypothetical protein JW791_03665 [Nanoarchaeota archaeon]|nr:hypothetical protein [Nanoarchaeota archaeon]
MGFDENKKNVMRKYEDAKKQGFVDADILKQLNSFNKLRDYYTTSSCSGRILLLRNNEENLKMPGAFYYKSHDKASDKVLINNVKSFNESFELWFKLEPFILHVCCRSLNHARKLLNMCRSLGIKRAGINAWSRRIIVEIVGTQYVDTLIIKDKKLLVSEDYLKILLSKANNKLSQSKKVLFKFFKDSKVLKK